MYIQHKGKGLMSTHRFISSSQRSMRLMTFFVLNGLLIALQIVLSTCSTAFASAPHLQDPPQNVARVGVSVVRLITSYVDAKGEPVGQCTGLGVVVRSWTAQNASDQKNNWVLTDGSLVNPGPNAVCINSSPEGKLASIQITFSSLYNPQPTSFTINAPALDVRCQQPGCSNGPALFPFPSDSAHTQPFADVATTDQRQIASIMLTKKTTSTEIPPSSNTDSRRVVEYTQQIVPQYLTPIQSLQINAPSNQHELGTPITNSAGELTGMHLNSTGSFTADDIRAFITSKVPELNNSPLPHLNPLHDSWNRGIAAYYQKDYTAARVAFQAAQLANPQFEAAQTFAQLSIAAAVAAGSENNGRTAGQQPPAGVTIGNLFIPLWPLIMIGLLVLIALLVLVSLTFGRARAKRKRALKAEYAAAEQQAIIDAQRIAEAEAPQLRRSHDPASQPTLIQGELSPSNGGTNGWVASAPAAPAQSIADQPTLDMATGAPRNGQVDAQQTVPYDVQHLKGDRLGLAVITQTDPGIKRKYKPNEDSLFAVKGMRTDSPAPQNFGLFVIADGMGGHANGQDASRLAIQTIIDYVLPRLLKDTELHDNGFAQLLVEGVKQANRAVHQHNIERHGDMGTTVTAALVVGTTAYVANVGDSRTYLYRKSTGLTKITQDHSVVASLVEAGIIKPDDIYTHPKRNQIYRSLGEKPAIDVDWFTEQLQPGDKLLLCSDGLWDMVRDPKIEEVIKKAERQPDKMGSALVQAALDGGGEDNVSVIVVQVIETPQGELKPGVQLLAKPDSVQMPPLS